MTTYLTTDRRQARHQARRLLGARLHVDRTSKPRRYVVTAPSGDDVVAAMLTVADHAHAVAVLLEQQREALGRVARALIDCRLLPSTT